LAAHAFLIRSPAEFLEGPQSVMNIERPLDEKTDGVRRPIQSRPA
jgi:hypothetical protein